MTWLLPILLIFVLFLIGLVALSVLSRSRSASSPEFDDRYASHPMGRSTEEQVLFDEKGVTVTPVRLVSGPHDYSLSRVREANIKKVANNWVLRFVAIVIILVGIVLAVVGSYMISKDIQAPLGAFPLLIGSGLFVLGRLLLSVITRYRVVLQTESAEVEAVEHSDFFFIQKVVQAINRAIESRDST